MIWDFETIQNIGLLITVGVVWGVTNPFMEKGTQSSKDIEEKKNDFGWKSFLKTITNFKFLVPFLLNQIGSLLYYFLLGKISAFL